MNFSTVVYQRFNCKSSKRNKKRKENVWREQSFEHRSLIIKLLFLFASSDGEIINYQLFSRGLSFLSLFIRSLCVAIWAIMALHNIIILVALSRIYQFVNDSASDSAAVYSNKLVRYVGWCISLFLFPPICSVMAKFSKSSFIIICLCIFSCLFQVSVFFLLSFS